MMCNVTLVIKKLSMASLLLLLLLFTVLKWDLLTLLKILSF